MNAIRGDKYTGTLEIGQHIYSILSGGRNGYIYEISGDQRPDTIQRVPSLGMSSGGGAHFNIVFDDGTYSKGLPECILRGVQWHIFETIADALTLEKALFVAECETIRKQELEKSKKEARQKAREGMPGKYPHLTPATEANKYNGHVLGAKNLRIELKKAFPGIKFSVKSESYSGGCSINARWTDGPTISQVEAFSKKYQYGSFDGMTDSYDYNREQVFTEVFGGAKYVFAERDYSERYSWTLNAGHDFMTGEPSASEQVRAFWESMARFSYLPGYYMTEGAEEITLTCKAEGLPVWERGIDGVIEKLNKQGFRAGMREDNRVLFCSVQKGE